MAEMIERKRIFKALVGSTNYNLNVEEGVTTFTRDGGEVVINPSDKDYKVFFLPTFEDLYKGDMHSVQKITELADYDIHDIRKLPTLFYKANINFLEVLFSTEITSYNGLGKRSFEIVTEIFSLKDEIARMNLPYLYNACYGMHLSKMKLLEKGTEGTQYLVDAFGYDTKQALHAYRVLDFLKRFAYTGFSDFLYAMRYDAPDKAFMLDIKNGFFDLETYKNFIAFYSDVIKSFKEEYYAQEPNANLKQRLDELIMELVKINIHNS